MQEMRDRCSTQRDGRRGGQKVERVANEEQKLTEREKGKQTEKDKQGIRRKKKIDVG